MTFFTVVHGESHGHVADPAEISLQVERHRKMLCCLFLYVKDVRMTVVAIEPPYVRLVRKDRRRYVIPLRLEVQGLIISDLRRFDR